MRRIGDLMRDMGFNSDAPEGTREAFFRHLVQAAHATSPRIPSQTTEQKPADIQLSFDPAILGTVLDETKKKKSSGAR